MGNFQDDFEEERATNLSAVVAALQLWNHEEAVSLILHVLYTRFLWETVHQFFSRN